LQLYEEFIPCTATVALTESQEDPPNSNVHAEQDSVNPITSNTGDESQTTPSSTALAAEDPVAVAAGFLLHFKGKSGITQTVLTELIQMNQAVVGSVLANLSSELTNVLESNEVDLKSPLATRILEAVERQNDQLDGLQTTYRQNLYLQTQYPTVVSLSIGINTCWKCCFILMHGIYYANFIVSCTLPIIPQYLLTLPYWEQRSGCCWLPSPFQRKIRYCLNSSDRAD